MTEIMVDRDRNMHGRERDQDRVKGPITMARRRGLARDEQIQEKNKADHFDRNKPMALKEPKRVVAAFTQRLPRS